MIDCADRMVLAWRFATCITADDLGEMLRDAVWHRFGGARTHARGIEFLSHNGPEYTSHWFRPVCCAPWDSSRATRRGGVRSQTAWRRRSLAASSETMSIRRVSRRLKT